MIFFCPKMLSDFFCPKSVGDFFFLQRGWVMLKKNLRGGDGGGGDNDSGDDNDGGDDNDNGGRGGMGDFFGQKKCY